MDSLRELIPVNPNKEKIGSNKINDLKQKEVDIMVSENISSLVYKNSDSSEENYEK